MVQDCSHYVIQPFIWSMNDRLPRGSIQHNNYLQPALPLALALASVNRPSGFNVALLVMINGGIDDMQANKIPVSMD